MNERYIKWYTPWLRREFVKHWLDDAKWSGHDWNYGQDMLPYYLSLL
jgi:hypothetical protein